MIKAVLFDLDGTLLPMDQDKFVNSYLYLLSKKAANYGYESKRLVKTIWAGTNNMISNVGNDTNETIFWETFTNEYGNEALHDKIIFDKFYFNEFESIKDSCGYTEKSRKAIDLVKSKNFITVLATNPIFPRVATEARMRWAGLNTNDFKLYTTYENSNHCKPNLEYYKDILNLIACKPEECVMIGNDVEEDMIASELGIKTFLLTDCLINKYNKDINEYKNGGFDELIDYLNEL